MDTNIDNIILNIEEDLNPRKRQISFSSDSSDPISCSLKSDDAISSDDAMDGDQKIQYFVDSYEDELTENVADTFPLNQISEACIGTICSTSERESSFVAEVSNGAHTADLGTRLCLENGTYVGTVVSIFGPVDAALFTAKMSNHIKFSELLRRSKIKIGGPLHYILKDSNFIFSPSTQCDATAGTDASYLNDEELPENIRPDFSDDEKELSWVQANRLCERQGDGHNLQTRE